MTEILVIAFPHLKDPLIKILSRSLILHTKIFMFRFPVFKLMITTAVESSMTLAALEERFLVTDLTDLHLRGCWIVELFSHFKFEY